MSPHAFRAAVRLLPRLLCTMTLGATTAVAQTRAEPRRPRLPATADTNSAAAYYQLAMARLRRDPAEAAAALYWASRLEPGSAEVLYARHVAMLLNDPDVLDGWVRGDRRILRTPRVLVIDSMRQRAAIINPFFRRALDADLIEQYVENRVLRDRRGLSVTEVQFEVREFLDDIDDPAIRGWLLSSRGVLTGALLAWAPALRRDSTSVRMRVDRANVYVTLGRLDSARADLEAALAAARRADTTRIWHVYESKAALEYTLGILLARTGDTAGARAAFQQALVEHLGFYPAHIRLGQLALAARDTAGAVTEYERAIAIRDDDYDARLMLGFLLGSLRRFDEAVPHLERATRAEPWAVTPVDVLAQIHEAAGHTAEALAAYRRFVQLCRRDDPARGAALQRIAELGGTAAPRP